MAFLVADHNLSVRRACAALRLSRAAYYRTPAGTALRDEPVIDALNEVIESHPRWGFQKCFDRLRLKGMPWNHKRVLRVYREMNLNLPRRTKKRLPRRERQTLEVPCALNAIWSFDFMSDALYRGPRFRVLNILDEGVREALDIVVDTSIPGARLVRALDQLAQWRGYPSAIRCDNGPEALSQVFIDWCEEHGIEILYIQPGKPNQNAFIERFNRTYRNEVLDVHLFTTLHQVRELSYRWLRTYNEIRPHESLGGLPPALFAEQLMAQNSSFELST